MRRKWQLLTLVFALAIATPARAEINVQVISHVGVHRAIDDLAGLVEVVNRGDTVTLVSATFNRPDCRLRFYAPEGVAEMMELVTGMPGYLVLDDEQAQFHNTFAPQQGGVPVRLTKVVLQPGDRIALHVYSINPQFTFHPNAASCGNAVLIRMTLETTTGPLHFEWD